MVHVVHNAALLVELKLPLAQAAQVRSVVVVPSCVTYVPARQVVLATQAVAGLPSLSHVPDTQVVCGLVPPAQYWPATHGVQTAGKVGVPGVVCTVPATQAPWFWHCD